MGCVRPASWYMHVKRRFFRDDSFELLLGHACEIRVKLDVFVVVALRKCFCGGASRFCLPWLFLIFLYTLYIQCIWIHLTYIVPNSIQSASCGCCYCFLTFKALLSWGAQGLPRHNADSLLLILVMFATVVVALVGLVLVLALCDVMYFFLILLSLSSMSATTNKETLATRKNKQKPPEPRAQKVTKATEARPPEPKNRERNSTWHPTKQTSLRKKTKKNTNVLSVYL